jgi:transposase
LWRLGVVWFKLGVWTQENRGRMADTARKTKRYPTDLTNEEWERIEPLLPKPPKRGRKVSVDLREMLNAIRYMARSGGGWRMLPTNFGPWQAVHWWFRRFVRRLLFQTIHDVSLMLDRERAGREASPSGGVLDSQTVKAPHAQARGYDANKKIVVRKRHIAVDTDGRLLMVNLTTADISDSAADPTPAFRAITASSNDHGLDQAATVGSPRQSDPRFA